MLFHYFAVKISRSKYPWLLKKITLICKFHFKFPVKYKLLHNSTSFWVTDVIFEISMYSWCLRSEGSPCISLIVFTLLGIKTISLCNNTGKGSFLFECQSHYLYLWTLICKGWYEFCCCCRSGSVGLSVTVFLEKVT